MISKKILPFIFISIFFIWSCQRNNKSTESITTISSYQDTAFWQEYHKAYPINKGDESNHVRSIAVDENGTVWIATASGVFRKNRNEKIWTDVIPQEDQGPSFAVVIDNQSSVWMSTWKNVYRFKNEKLEIIPTVKSPIAALCNSSEGMYALGPHGVWLINDSDVKKINRNIARSIHDVVSDNEHGLWIATDVGLYHSMPDTTIHYVQPNELISAFVHGLDFDSDKKLWTAGLGGVTIRNKNEAEKFLTIDNGLPSVHANCVKRSPDGAMWVGTDVGVVRFYSNGNHSLLFSRRWLMDDQVNNIAFDKEGTAWVATSNGVSAIKRKRMTLASKSNYFYDVLMKRHIREPWIAGQCTLPIAGDTSQWQHSDDDNDGEYNGHYLAMESFRYAVTKSADAKTKAAKTFRFLKSLQEITETDGFFARSIVRTEDWEIAKKANHTYNERQLADELVKEPRYKPIENHWHKSCDGKWLWKNDASSDELCGQMFGYYFYYELVANDDEKKIIANHVTRLVDYLIKNNYNLTDIDGTSTRWGVWSPDKLNRDAEWQPDRSINSMELLAFLKFAYHVSNNEKYQREYFRLIHEEHYLENMGNIAQQNPAWVIYTDVMMAAYEFPILLRCEKDTALLHFYEKHIDDWFEKRKADENPLVNFIYCYSRNKKVELKNSVRCLIETPLDLVDWNINHTKREDIHIVHKPVLDELQVNELPSPTIRATIRWDKNPWRINEEGNPHLEREPIFWLLPYWMGRYLEMIDNSKSIK